MKTFTKFKRPLLIFFLIINSFFYSHASTGDCEGWITDYSGGSLTFTALREGYISFWGNEPMGVSITVSGNDMPYESTVCIVDGMLSNITTMENALGADKKMYIHNNRNWTQMYAIYSTPIVLEGEVINTDLGNNQFTIE